MPLVQPKSRFLRPQFSLRTLLVLTTVVAVGLMVFRWPWTVERQRFIGSLGPKDSSLTNAVQPYRGRITVRRAWNGKPEQHGVALHLWLGLHQGFEEHYANGELVSRRVFRCGEPVEYEYYRNGTLVSPPTHIPRHDISGVWTMIKQHGDELVTQRVAWRNAERHGLSTWTSSNGQVLQSAEFDHGRIVKWNGEPAAEALERWIEERVENEDFHKPLLTELANADAYAHWPQSRRGIVWHRNEGIVVAHFSFIGVHFAEPPDWVPCFAGRRLGEVILEIALNDSGMLDHRYGAPCIVPICTSELSWQDPTGIMAVKFDPESQAAKEWTAPAHIGSPWLTKWPATQLKELCEDKAIKVDTSAVDHIEPPPYAGPIPNGIPDYSRPLRDLFGHILYDSGYRCEQRGETLVVLPQGLNLPRP